MNVVHLINGLPRVGGAERLILGLAECSKSKPVPVITWRTPDNSLLELDITHALDVVSLWPPSLRELRRALRTLRRADVVHIHLFPSLYLAPLIPRPTVFTEHNTWNRRRDLRWLRPLERYVYRQLSKVVCISSETADALQQWLGEKPRRCEVIPNGIHVNRFSLSRRAPPAGPPYTVGMVARFAREKDQATLIKALAFLPKTYRLLLGGHGTRQVECEQLTRDLELEQRVRFVGPVSDVRDFFSGIDLYVQSSNADGFSIVTVEALASGLPVLASDIAGLRDTVNLPEMLFPHGDFRALAHRIRETVENRHVYEFLTAHAVSRATNFHIRETAKKYNRAYEAVARKRV